MRESAYIADALTCNASAVLLACIALLSALYKQWTAARASKGWSLSLLCAILSIHFDFTPIWHDSTGPCNAVVGLLESPLWSQQRECGTQVDISGYVRIPAQSLASIG